MKPGTVVRATVLARLFGLKLLTVEARVVLAPAEVAEEPRVRPGHRLPPVPPALPIGSGLLEATRTLDQGAASLAAARTGPRPG